MPRILLPGVLTALFLSLPLLTASPPGDEIATQALKAKARGDYTAAQHLTGKALTNLLAPGWQGDESTLGQASYLLYLYTNISRLTGQTNTAIDFLQALTRQAKLAEKTPALADLTDRLIMQMLRLTLRWEEALAYTNRLGFIRRWQMIGPFNNERGQGADISYPPEKGIDLKAIYQGKRGKVRWREIDFHQRPGGVNNLGAVLRPNEQALAYTATSVNFPTATTAILKTGSAGLLKVWVNGQPVISSDARRPFRYDQDHAVVHLHKGPNFILVKCGTQEGAFSFALRFCSLNGKPISGLPSHPFPQLLKAKPLAKKTKPEPATPDPIQLLAWLHKKTGKPETAFRCAFLLSMIAPFDQNDPQDHKWILKALKDEPGNAHYHFLQALTLKAKNSVAAEKDENPRRRALEECLRLDPDYAEAELELGLYYFRGQNNVTQGLKHFRRAREINPGFVKAGLAYAEALELMDGYAEAQRLREQLFAKPENQNLPLLVREIAQFENLQGKPGKAADILQHLLSQNATTGLAALTARTMIKANRREAAMAMLAKAGKGFPYSTTLPATIASLHAARGDFTKAANTLENRLKLCPDDDNTMIQLGELAGEAGNQEGMISWFKQALACDPGRDRIRRRLEFLQKDEKSFFANLEIETMALLAAAPPVSADAIRRNDSHDLLLKHKVIEVNQDGTSHIYEHLVVRILTESGVQKFQAFTRSYFGGEQSGRILKAQVIHKDGSTSRARINNRFSPYLTNTARIQVRMPAIRPGDTVDISFRIDEIKTSFFGTYFGHQHIFSARESAPVHLSRLDLVTPVARQITFNSKNGAAKPTEQKLPNGKILRTWELEELPPVKAESRMPGGHEICPTVEISTYRNWQEFGHWWWSMIRRQYDCSNAMRAKTSELTKDLTGATKKIKAIYNFVITEVRYVAWEFGVHGYKPYKASTIFSRRHGDCKDKAILLGAMLKEIGIDAWPVLINADNSRSRDDLSTVIVNHFNHCIAYIPATGNWPGGFLDGTAQYHPIDTLPNMDRGAMVIAMVNGKPEIMQVPWSKPEDNTDRRIYQIQLKSNGDAMVTFTGRPTGSQAVGVRHDLGNEQGKRKEKLDADFAQRLGKVAVESFKFSDLMDLDRPVHFSVKMKVEGFAEKRGKSLVLKPCFETADWIQQAPTEKRIHDLLLINPWLDHYTVEYILPPGWKPDQLPPDRKGSGEVGFFQITWRLDGQRLIADVLRALKVQRIPSKQFKNFRELASSLDNAETQVVLVSPTRKGGN